MSAPVPLSLLRLSQGVDSANDHCNVPPPAFDILTDLLDGLVAPWLAAKYSLGELNAMVGAPVSVGTGVSVGVNVGVGVGAGVGVGVGVAVEVGVGVGKGVGVGVSSPIPVYKIPATSKPIITTAATLTNTTLFISPPWGADALRVSCGECAFTPCHSLR